MSINPDGAGGGLAGTNPTGVTVRDADITDTGTQATQAGIELTHRRRADVLAAPSASRRTAARALDLTGAALQRHARQHQRQRRHQRRRLRWPTPPAA